MRIGRIFLLTFIGFVLATIFLVMGGYAFLQTASGKSW